VLGGTIDTTAVELAYLRDFAMALAGNAAFDNLPLDAATPTVRGGLYSLF
jgi:hypothetical protein